MVSAVNYFLQKAPYWMFGGVLNTPPNFYVPYSLLKLVAEILSLKSSKSTLLK